MAVQPRLDYVAIQDAAYYKNSQTSILDTPNDAVRFATASTVLYRDITTGGLSNSNDIKPNAISSAWNSYQVEYDRSTILAFDDVEGDNAGGNFAADTIVKFMKSNAIPELDAYRYASYAGTTGIVKDSVDLDMTLAGKGDFANLLRLGILDMKDAGCTAIESDLVIFASPEFYAGLTADIPRVLGNDNTVNTNLLNYNGSVIVPVCSQTIFKDKISLTGNGWTNPTGTADINFLIVDPAALLQVQTHQYGDYFPAGVYQGKPGCSAYNYRSVGGALVHKNMKAGVYANLSATVTA